MRNHTIAIQGTIASFHELAAKKYFGEDCTILECGSFREVCDRVANNQADYAVIAIENKIAGSILLNYQLIETFDLTIIGETFLPIELHLLAKEGVQLDDITEIISHPMALGQCQNFLSGLTHPKITEFKDTAASAKLVQHDSSNSMAVIAGPIVAETYNLVPLVQNVGDEVENYTRFYILSKGSVNTEEPNKASVTIQLSHQIGILSKVLKAIGDEGINLSKIQSIPIPNDNSRYSFHLDLEFETRTQLDDALVNVVELVDKIKVLGIYTKSN